MTPITDRCEVGNWRVRIRIVLHPANHAATSNPKSLVEETPIVLPELLIRLPVHPDGVLRQAVEPGLRRDPADRGPPMRAAGAELGTLPAVSDRPTPSTHDTRSNRPSRTGRPHAGDNPPLGTAATFLYRRSYSGCATAEPRSAASGGRCPRTAEGSPRCYVPEYSPSGTEFQPGATRHDAEAEYRYVRAGR